jgi:hypothetical protein
MALLESRKVYMAIRGFYQQVAIPEQRISVEVRNEGRHMKFFSGFTGMVGGWRNDLVECPVYQRCATEGADDKYCPDDSGNNYFY